MTLKLALGEIEIEVGLQVHPELLALAEGAAETQREFGGDGARLA